MWHPGRVRSRRACGVQSRCRERLPGGWSRVDSPLCRHGLDEVRAFVAELVDRLEAGFDLVRERVEAILPRELRGLLAKDIEAHRGEMREAYAEVRAKLGTAN